MSMSSSVSAAAVARSAPAPSVADRPRHSATVRVTHWVAAACFLALLVSGLEIVVSHPRFYLGETGNTNMKALFQIPIPASRAIVNTGYNYTLPDQNGWSRALHFQSAWFLVLTGIVYLIYGFTAGHFRRELLPAASDRSFRSVLEVFKHHLRFQRPSDSEAWSYNVLQRLAYVVVLFVMVPLMIWTGLAMSPSFTGAFPYTVILLGGRQTARTLHFFDTLALTGFLFVHVLMVWRAGFWSRVRAMITGHVRPDSERV